MPVWVRAVLGPAGSETWVAALSAPTDPLRADAICLLDRRTAQACRLVPVPARPLDVLANMMSLDLGPERERTRFQLACALLDEARSYRMEASPSDPPHVLADLVPDVVRQ